MTPPQRMIQTFRVPVVRATAAVLLSFSGARATETDIIAQFCPGVTLDGMLDEYSCGRFLTITDESSPEGGVDITATVVWDEDNLYLPFQMGDTYLNAHAEKDDDTLALRDDCFQIFIDPDNSRDHAMGSGDFRIIITVLDYVLDGSGWDNWEWDGNVAHALFRIATVNENEDVDQGGSFVELAVPWTSLGVTPSEGMEMGMLFGFTDLDAEGTPYRGNHLSLDDPNRPDQWARVELRGGDTGRRTHAPRKRAHEGSNGSSYSRAVTVINAKAVRRSGCELFSISGASIPVGVRLITPDQYHGPDFRMLLLRKGNSGIATLPR